MYLNDIQVYTKVKQDDDDDNYKWYRVRQKNLVIFKLK